MLYEKYINLGFKREEIDCDVTLKETGYSGYILRKELFKGITIETYFGELEQPILFIQKKDSECNGFRAKISIEFMECLISYF